MRIIELCRKGDNYLNVPDLKQSGCLDSDLRVLRGPCSFVRSLV